MFLKAFGRGGNFLPAFFYANRLLMRGIARLAAR